LSNFPPAPIFVITTSNAETPSFLWVPTGIPLPLSLTVIELFSFMITSILSQCPAMASSIELSTTSYTRWWSPLELTSPMYMDGLMRTCSIPSKAWMLSAEYWFLLVSSLIFYSSLLCKNFQRTNIRKPLLYRRFFYTYKAQKLSTSSEPWSLLLQTLFNYFKS